MMENTALSYHITNKHWLNLAEV